MLSPVAQGRAEVGRTAFRIGPDALPLTLVMPVRAHGLVLFAHHCHSPQLIEQDLFLAQVWRAYGLGSLQFDLSGAPAQSARALPAAGAGPSAVLVSVLDWAAQRADLRGLPVGLFGSGAGASSALRVAALESQRIGAVVTNAGHTDLAQDLLARIQAPTLMILGQRDQGRLERSNRRALHRLQCEARLERVPGTTLRLARPGTFDLVVGLAGHWFEQHLVPRETGTIDGRQTQCL